MSNRFFVTGTDTGVGKTMTSILLTKGLGARYWKPIQTGSIETTDTTTAAKWLAPERIAPAVYSFPQPASPHEAARAVGETIDFDRVLGAFRKLDGPLVIEGAGGILVPLNEKHLLVDLIQALGLGAIVVARTSLGTINHSLMTLEALRSRQIKVHGVLYVGEENTASAAAIEKYGRTRTLGRIPHTEEFSESWFTEEFASLCKGVEFCRLVKN